MERIEETSLPSGSYLKITFANEFKANAFAKEKAKKATTGIIRVVGSDVRVYNFDSTDKSVLNNLARDEKTTVSVVNEENDIFSIVEEILRG